MRRSDSKRLGRMPIERDDFLRPGVLEKQGRVIRGEAQPKPEVAGLLETHQACHLINLSVRHLTRMTPGFSDRPSRK